MCTLTALRVPAISKVDGTHPRKVQGRAFRDSWRMSPSTLKDKKVVLVRVQGSSALSQCLLISKMQKVKLSQARHIKGVFSLVGMLHGLTTVAGSQEP